MESAAVTAQALGTISGVSANKGLPEGMAAHVVRLVAEIIARDFTDRDGKVWSERRIAAAMGMAQPVLHTVRNGRGIGIHALLALRAYTGQSIDAVLGLAIPERETQNIVQLDELQKQIDALTELVKASAGKQPGPHSKAGKALDALRTARARAAGQRQLDERARKANEPVKRKGVA